MARGLYLETGSDGGALLYAFDPPGLVARGASLAEALSAAPGGLAELMDIRRVVDEAREWQVSKPRSTGPVSTDAPAFEIVETFARRGVVANGRTTATFSLDLVPLTREEVDDAIELLAESRRRLVLLRPAIEASADVEGVLGHRSTAARWTIEMQLRHIASVERWYLAKILSGLPRLPSETCPWQRLTAVRLLVVRTLRRLTDSELGLQVKEESREVWTPRKVVRRLMYHEKFHRDTIRRDFADYLHNGPSSLPDPGGNGVLR